MIDPGHGGKDPGASSRQGLREKDITLGIATALRDELLKSERYDVALTRSTDVFIELEDRVTKARNLGADLFISLHADAGAKPATRGASVYTLSPEGEKRVEAARKQNDWILDVEVDSVAPAGSQPDPRRPRAARDQEPVGAVCPGADPGAGGGRLAGAGEHAPQERLLRAAEPGRAGRAAGDGLHDQ